jgi:uncharacterized membrane protein
MMGDGYGGGYGDVRWHMMGQSGTTGLWVLVLVLVLLLVAAVVALAWSMRQHGQPPGSTAPRRTDAGESGDGGESGSADRILAERLARGDITEDEYRRTRAALHER